MKLLFPILLAASLPASAIAQQAGSTYPNGSNLPQRSAGEVAPKATGTMGGSASTGSAATVSAKAARKNRARSQRIHRTHKSPQANASKSRP